MLLKSLATLYLKTMTIVTIEEWITMINGVKNPRSSLWLWLEEAKRKKNTCAIKNCWPRACTERAVSIELLSVSKFISEARSPLRRGAPLEAIRPIG